jgi:gamma-glutamyltranspeptidase/glutathione hydrolase
MSQCCIASARIRPAHAARWWLLAASLLVAVLATPVFAQLRPAPEGASDWQPKQLATATQYIVAAAHPAAVDAGLAVLREGGNAVDAAIAVQLVLNLVEPQSSGIGGGTFLLYHDAATGDLTAWDGRETAPAGATADMFLDADGKPLAFRAAMLDARSVGVPGVVALLANVHAAYGSLPWAGLFAPAIALARDGFTVGPRLAGLLADAEDDALRRGTAGVYFYPGGEPLRTGDIVRNPVFADTLERIAAGGRDTFYRGDIARDIAAATAAAPGAPGRLTEADLAAYEAPRRAPVCAAYRVWQVCGMGPPSSGGIAVGQILGMLARFDLPAMAPASPQPWHLIAEASKLAFADRNRYVADGDAVAVPLPGLLAPAYLAQRAALIDPAQVLPAPAAAGEPPRPAGPARAPDSMDGRPGTTHISIVDGAGNAVSMTSSIEGAFGSHRMVRGFLLNNELTDFSFRPVVDGAPVANAAAPGKRPRSSMAPTIVYGPDGRLRLLAGSSGGSRIIGNVVQTVVAVLDWGLDPQAAVDLPHLLNRNGATEVEARADADALADALTAHGHMVRRPDVTSGLHVIGLGDGRLHGGADPRREGVARGD